MLKQISEVFHQDVHWLLKAAQKVLKALTRDGHLTHQIHHQALKATKESKLRFGSSWSHEETDKILKTDIVRLGKHPWN